MKPSIKHILPFRSRKAKGYPNRIPNGREKRENTHKHTHKHTNTHVRIYISRDFEKKKTAVILEEKS